MFLIELLINIIYILLLNSHHISFINILNINLIILVMKHNSE